MERSRSFQKKIRTVRVRCGIGLLLRHAGRVLAIAGAIFGLAVLVRQLFAVPVLAPQVLWGFGGLAGGLVLVLWLRRLPGRMQACLLLDERLRLRERFSTTLALANCDDPFARAARDESLQAVERVNLRGHFPVGLSRSWYYGAGLWLAAIAILLYMPQKDLLGLSKNKQRQQQQAVQLADAAAQIQQTTEPVRALVKELRDPSLAEELKKLDELSQVADPQEMKRQAIKTLGDLSEKIKQMQDGAQMQAGEMLQQMLRQLHGSSNPFAQQLRVALAQGNYAQVAGALRQMQEQLGAGSLNDEKRKELAAQLQELAKELQKVAEQEGQVENELAKLGLDKALAQASPEQLKEALQEQGVAPELAEQLAQKVKAGQIARGQCSGLGETLAGVGAGGEVLSADNLSDAIEQLDAWEVLQEQTETLRASAKQISGAVEVLGQGACEGLGGGLGQQGQAKPGSGGGQGEGIGLSPGEHSITSDPLTANKMTRAPTQADDSPVVAGGYFRDTLIKGEAQRPFAEVIQAGRASAAEAITDNQIPRRYEETIKKYFNQLEESRR